MKTPKIPHPPRSSKQAPGDAIAEKYLLRLYVAGATARSRQALRRVYLLCEGEMKGNYDLEVIDVYQQPELARANQIVATPTLVREVPRPARRFIGSLLNTAGLFDKIDGVAIGMPAV